ncbi:Extracellular solute-binding protein family 1 [uncultured Pleomorphomonas sp.]|uniref:Extracellular solute-binding protein family 1 n=1 Tax=uncultured Pleomorphomonas sp. TaxID=442121 RepID=A0A212LBP0_9HYPH|nr:sugar ABC transporter substrate-binding protein [uncultured Pleomorphomonas sp.]SCM74983.1 Extracellular solute-binding protein family 1 [uncultured Pleomorphomonas sp.]
MHSIYLTLAGSTAASMMALGLTVASAAPIELNFWDMNWGGTAYVDAAKALVDEFNKNHADVQVTYRSVPWSNWYETYVTAIASGSAPDISTGAGFQAVQFYDFGEILPVDDVVAAIGPDAFSKGTLDAVKWDDHYIALPWMVDIRAIFYRTDLLTTAGIEPPTTWDEFRAAAKKLSGSGTYGIVSSGDSGGSHWVPTSMINNGSGMFDSERKAAMTSERSMEALDFLGGLVADGSVNPSSTGYTSDDARGSFQRGEAGFILDGPNLPELISDAKNKTAVLPPLKGPHGDLGTVYWVNNIMVYKQSKHPKETMDFLKWWSDNQLSLWTKGDSNGIPARMEYQKDPYFQGRKHVAYIIDNYLPVARPMSAVAGGTFPAMNEVDGDGFLRTLVQKIWQGQSAVDAAREAQAHLEELLKK